MSDRVSEKMLVNKVKRVNDFIHEIDSRTSIDYDYNKHLNLQDDEDIKEGRPGHAIAYGTKNDLWYRLSAIESVIIQMTFHKKTGVQR